MSYHKIKASREIKTREYSFNRKHVDKYYNLTLKFSFYATNM